MALPMPSAMAFAAMGGPGQSSITVLTVPTVMTVVHVFSPCAMTAARARTTASVKMAVLMHRPIQRIVPIARMALTAQTADLVSQDIAPTHVTLPGSASMESATTAVSALSELAALLEQTVMIAARAF